MQQVKRYIQLDQPSLALTVTFFCEHYVDKPTGITFLQTFREGKVFDLYDNKFLSKIVPVVESMLDSDFLAEDSKIELESYLASLKLYLEL